MQTLHGWHSGQRCLQLRVVSLKPYRGRHPGPGQCKERLAVFAVVSRFPTKKGIGHCSALTLNGPAANDSWGRLSVNFCALDLKQKETPLPRSPRRGASPASRGSDNARRDFRLFSVTLQSLFRGVNTP
jgi:hypothetical protein